METTQRRSRQDLFREVSFERVIRELAQTTDNEMDGHGWRRGWGRYANEADIARLARAFTSLPTDRPEQIVRYLQVFAGRPFPLDPSYLIREVRRSDHSGPRPAGHQGEWSWEERRTWFALLALENVVHPAVRALGLELLDRKGWESSGAGLLERNAGPGDLPRIVEAFLREPDVHERHGIGMSIKKLSKHRQPPGIAEALGAVYEFGPCECCRSAVVRRLIELDLLPAWMAEEGRYDADDGVREAIAERNGD
jgi:hypothetical protein